MHTSRDILGPGGLVSAQLPGYEPREQQLEMTDMVEQAITTRQHAVIEAGTGTGKSLGYLVPAILSGKTVVVSTGDKNLQEQIFRKDVPFLNSVMPQPFTAVLLKGMSNYVCLSNVDEVEQEIASNSSPFKSVEAAQVWPNFKAWESTTNDGDLDGATFGISDDLRALVTIESENCTGDKCPFAARCYSRTAKAKAEQADIVIANHALMLRDLVVRAATGGNAKLLPDADVVIIDESHALETAATEAWASEVSLSRLHRLMRRLDTLTVKHKTVKRDPSLREEAQQWSAHGIEVEKPFLAMMNAIREKITRNKSSENTIPLEDESIHGLVAAQAVSGLADMLGANYPDWLDESQREGWKRLTRSVTKLAVEITGATTPVPTYEVVRYAKLEEHNRLVLNVKPVNVAPILRTHLFRNFDTVICTSATLTTEDGFGWFRSRVGLDDTLELQLSSPFDYVHNSLLYLPQDGKAFDPRGGNTVQYLDRIANEIEDLLLASDGRAFVLFTSREAMNEVYKRLHQRLRYLVLKQDDLPRAEMVRRFKQDGKAVLFGMKSFWEGVDIIGDALSLVIIDKIPFTSPTELVYKARSDEIERTTGDKWAGLNKLGVPIATIALKQGFGRLIRSKKDRGVVAILDGRLTTVRYGSGMLRSLPPATQTRSKAAVRAFFGN